MRDLVMFRWDFRFQDSHATLRAFVPTEWTDEVIHQLKEFGFELTHSSLSRLAPSGKFTALHEATPKGLEPTDSNMGALFWDNDTELRLRFSDAVAGMPGTAELIHRLEILFHE